MCTQFGWFRTHSVIDKKMRSERLNLDYWKGICKETFPSLDMNVWPRVSDTKAIFGGKDMQAEGIFWTHGDEDPWAPACQKQSRPMLNQRVETSNCAKCGHQVDLKNPTEEDAYDIIHTRAEVRMWLSEMIRYQPGAEFLV